MGITAISLRGNSIVSQLGTAGDLRSPLVTTGGFDSHTMHNERSETKWSETDGVSALTLRGEVHLEPAGDGGVFKTR